MSQNTPDPEYQPFHSLPPRRRRSSRAVPPTPPAPLAPPPPGMTPEARIEMRRARRTQKRALPKIGAPMFVLAFAVLLVAGALIGYQLYLRDRAVPGVRVLGEEIGGMTAPADAQIHEKLGDPNVLLERFGGDQIILRDGLNVYRAWPWELGFRSDLRPALDAAFEIGHRSDLALSVMEQGRALLVGADVTASSAFDDAVARQYVSLLASQIDRPSRDASYRLEGMNLIEQPAHAGRRLDGQEPFNRIKAYAAQPGGEVALPIQDLVPNAVDAKQAQAQISAFLAAPLVLQFQDRSWAIDQAALTQMLTLQPASNPDGSLSYKAGPTMRRSAPKSRCWRQKSTRCRRDARFSFCRWRADTHRDEPGRAHTQY